MIVKLKEPLVGYKKVYGAKSLLPVIVKLLIPAGAFVRLESKSFWEEMPTKHNHQKMRASSAKVTSMTNQYSESKFRGSKVIPKCQQNTRGRTINYRVGKVARPHWFDRSDTQCAGGIHFFTNREDALSY